MEITKDLENLMDEARDGTLLIRTGDIHIDFIKCDHGLLYLSIENTVMDTFASAQISVKNKERLIEFLNQ